MECRICFEDASRCDLITPCYCSGTSAFVHHSCLQRWRETSALAARRCAECHYMYNLVLQYPLEVYKFKQYTTREASILRCILAATVITLIIFIRMIDIHSGFVFQKLLRPWGKNELLIRIIRHDSIFEFAYYFSLITFLGNAFFLSYFISVIITKIKRRSLYYKYIRTCLFQYIIFSQHGIILYNFCSLAKEGKNTMAWLEFYLCFNFFISFLQYLLITAIMKFHNEIIELMNGRDNPSIVLEFEDRV